MNIKVDVLGLPQLDARLGKISEWVNRGLSRTVEDAAKRFVDGLPPDPTPSRRSMLPFIKSDKQLRWLMWAINSGAITVPYLRTGDMRGSLRTDVKSMGGSFVGSVGASSPHAIYVIDEKRQAAYHKGTWWTLQAELRKGTRRILDVFTEALSKVMRG